MKVYSTPMNVVNKNTRAFTAGDFKNFKINNRALIRNVRDRAGYQVNFSSKAYY